MLLTSDELHIFGANGGMELWVIGPHKGFVKCDKVHPLMHRQTDKSRKRERCIKQVTLVY